MNTKEPVIHVKNFSKSYGTLEAVKNISFDVYANEIFGFVGPNGAGKSTTINTLCTIQPKSSGEITICGHDVETERDLVRNDIGVVFQDITLDGKLTVEETLKLHCDFYGVPIRETKERIDFVLELVDLTEERKTMVARLSGGMKRRVEIARGMLHYPKVLFLDEPTTGLDPRSRETVWQYIRRLQAEKGITIFLTTHYMEEAEVCTHMAVIQSGTITALDTPENLKRKYTKSILDISCFNKDAVRKQMETEQIVCYPFGNRLRTEVKNMRQAIDILKKSEEDISDFEFKHGTLNDVFLKITEKGDVRK